MDLKDTVNLPKTAFSMKANLPQNEPKMLEKWAQEGLYGRIRKARAGAPSYLLHDGPPYANGNIHLGHAINKTLKDFIVKSKTMAGFDSPYVPGWDCHGLPIEIKVDQELGARKAGMSALQIRAACRKYAGKYVELQRRAFERLGVFGRWDDPYLTMSAQYESVTAGAFVEMLDRGYVYKGLKPVHWCMRDRTALAEAEVEYENHSSPSVWVQFELPEGAEKIAPALAGRKVSAIIWTTTPWTIPANMAIAYHPKFEYVAVEAENREVYIVAQALLEATAARCRFGKYEVLASFTGEKLEGLNFRHPFLERVSRGILADHVTLEQGTGAVHTAPGHGLEDYIVGQQYGIATYCPVDAAGRFYHATGADGKLPDVLIGKTVWEANPLVLELLRERGALLAEEKIDHSYPHCWRCHQATIFRATEQWFIGMDRNELRSRTLEAIRGVKWIPEWGAERMSNMIATRPDWCISRQRIWGVPITAFYCDACQEPLTDRQVLDDVVRLFAEHTADVWYEREAADLMPPGTKCPCGGTTFRKESDILDVWFDSGSSHLAVLGHQPDLPWPANLYLEGADQYRGWFHSSLLIGMGVRGEPPYRECLTHGFVLDAQGRAMSKSVGNTIEPEDVIKSHGAEILRLCASSIESREDARISPDMLTRLSEAYRKLRNTFRYMLGNLHGFDPALHTVPVDRMQEIDQWALLRADQLVTDCRRWYEEFAFHKVHHSALGFATVDLSSLYFDVLKDRLYTAATGSPARRSAQTALYRLTHALVRLLAPVLTFTCEEVWQLLPKLPGDPESVHLALFPTPGELAAGLKHSLLLANWDRLIDVRETVLKALETARQGKFINSSLEARVRLSVNGMEHRRLSHYLPDLPMLFIVSQVVLDDGGPDLAVKVERADGVKCERCWKYATDVGSSSAWPTICGPCAQVVDEMQRGN